MSARNEHGRWRRIRQLAWVLLLVVVVFKVAEFRAQDEFAIFGGGPVDVGVMVFASPDDMRSDVLRQLEDGGLEELEEWFNQEQLRYTDSKREWVRLHLHGPWGVPMQPPTLDRAQPMVSRVARSIQYVRWWEGAARDQGVEPGDFDARLYVAILPAGGDLAADSRGDAKRRTAVAHVSADERNFAYVQATLAHELAHALGATDRYDPELHVAQYPEGFVLPFERPLFPQQYAELMAVDRPTGPRQELEITDLSELRVGHRTAAELRWIELDEADAFYEPKTPTPESRIAWDQSPPDG